MAFQVKHVRPGILVVADAGLRFGPGQVLQVEALTPQLERAISAGVLVRRKNDRENKKGSPSQVESTTAAEAEAAEVAEIDLSKLRAADAISKVEAEDDADRLKAQLSNEHRRTVIAALEKRLVEVDAGDQ